MDRVVIKSNRVALPGKLESAYVVLQGGTIVDIVSHLPTGYTKLIDIGDKVLMPGVIDPHVHINEPGRTHWEGFHTATKAAMAGGVTTLVDMPLNSTPVTTTVAAFEKKLAAAENSLHVDVGFWGGVVPGNSGEINGLIEKGVLGFKAFLTHSGIDDFPNVSEADLEQVMPMIARHNLPLLVHCELSDMPLPFSGDPCCYNDYLSSRPKTWEDDAISLMIRLCKKFDCHVHIVHLSSADSLAQIREAKKHGLKLSVETAPHYLYLCSEEINDRQTAFKCAPPIRENENRESLWQGMKDSTIDFVATDHSPAPPDLKQFDTGDFMKAWGGISSLQWSLPVVWTAARERGCNINDLATWLCENPAKLLTRSLKRGRIAVGYSADLVVLDPEATFTVHEGGIYHRHKLTPYLGRELYGVVEQTWLAGTRIFNRGKMELNKGKKILLHQL